MKAQKFIKQLHHEDIVAAIREAERKTSGEIRVFISQKPVTEPVTAAQAEFVRLGMGNTAERNAVLIFVAPLSRQFAVIGDQGVHAKCGESFWQELTKAMTDHFSRNEFTQGIVHGVKKAGEILAKHFPCRPDDTNELPDQVEHD